MHPIWTVVSRTHGLKHPKNTKQGQTIGSDTPPHGRRAHKLTDRVKPMEFACTYTDFVAGYDNLATSKRNIIMYVYICVYVMYINMQRTILSIKGSCSHILRNVMLSSLYHFPWTMFSNDDHNFCYSGYILICLDIHTSHICSDYLWL